METWFAGYSCFVGLLVPGFAWDGQTTRIAIEAKADRVSRSGSDLSLRNHDVVFGCHYSLVLG